MLRIQSSSMKSAWVGIFTFCKSAPRSDSSPAAHCSGRKLTGKLKHPSWPSLGFTIVLARPLGSLSWSQMDLADLSSGPHLMAVLEFRTRPGLEPWEIKSGAFRTVKPLACHTLPVFSALPFLNTLHSLCSSFSLGAAWLPSPCEPCSLEAKQLSSASNDNLRRQPPSLCVLS